VNGLKHQKEKPSMVHFAGLHVSVKETGVCIGGLGVDGHPKFDGLLNRKVAYHGSDTEKYLGEVGGLDAPLLMHLGEEDEFISKAAQAEIKAALAGKANLRCSLLARNRPPHSGANVTRAAATP
jgi:dienelactone hydrolase